MWCLILPFRHCRENAAEGGGGGKHCGSVPCYKVKAERRFQAAAKHHYLLLGWLSCHPSNENPSKLSHSPQDLVKTPEHGWENPVSLHFSLSHIFPHPSPTFLSSGHLEPLRNSQKATYTSCPFSPLPCTLGSPSLATANSHTHASTLNLSPNSSEKQHPTPDKAQSQGVPLHHPDIHDAVSPLLWHAHVCTRTTSYVCFLFSTVRAGLPLMSQWPISMQLNAW